MRHMYALALVCLVGCSSHHKNSYHDVVLLAGQSNMVRFEQYGEETFRAEYKALHHDGNIDFIPCAVGGTESSQWLPGGELFDGCLEAAKGYKVTAILYYQGESDAANMRTNWSDNFTHTVNGFRSSFGDVPVVFAQIAKTTDPLFMQGWASVQAQQAATTISGGSMIQTEDIADLADTVHLTPESEKRVAVRFADAMPAREESQSSYRRLWDMLEL